MTMSEAIVNGSKCSVKLVGEKLVIEEMSHAKSSASFKREIEVKHILSVQYTCDKCPCVRLNHVATHTNKRLRVQQLDIRSDEHTCKTLQEKIANLLNDLPRPRRLLVFINPKSGHRKSVKIYRTKVRPLFRLAGIYTEIVETTRVGQPIDLLAMYDLSLIHGIVSIGGDGMFSECVNGLLRRLQADSKVDADDADADITPSNIPIGIIPTGSGNYLMNYIHGTKDVETATLKIILGDHHMSNVVSLHEGQRLTRYASLLVEFGLIGDMMHDCEKFRWMGPCRYSVIPMKSLAKRKVVDVKLEYLPEDAKAVSSPPRRRAYSRQKSLPASQIGDIPRSRLFSNPEGSVGKKINGWKQMEGSVYGVDSYVVTQREKQGALVPRFADDALTVWMTDKCGLSDHVEQLSRLQNAKSGFLDFDFVRKVRTTRYRVKLSSATATLDSDGKRHLKKKFYINADGEAIKLDTPEFEVKLHHEAMPIYGKIDGLP